jgi:protein farnesyltransferase subunit beta
MGGLISWWVTVTKPDGCYSFWQGGAAVLLELYLSKDRGGLLFNREALQDYVLACCQDPRGGMRDKPEK